MLAVLSTYAYNILSEKVAAVLNEIQGAGKHEVEVSNTN